MVSLCRKIYTQTNKIYISLPHTHIHTFTHTRAVGLCIEKPKKTVAALLFNSSAIPLFVAIKGFRTVELSSIISFNIFGHFLTASLYLGWKRFNMAGFLPKSWVSLNRHTESHSHKYLLVPEFSRQCGQFNQHFRSNKMYFFFQSAMFKTVCRHLISWKWKKASVIFPGKNAKKMRKSGSIP